jgi:hypothetical protein
MNCQLFEEVVVDLARGHVADESVLARATAHRQSCSRCAARLADEQALSAMLQLPDSNSAPGRVEDALLAAYREHFGEAVPAPQSRSHIPVGMLALAASLVLMLSSYVTYKVLRSSRPETPKQTQSVPVNSPARSAATEPANQEAENPKPAVALNAGPAVPAAPRRAIPEETPAQGEIASDFIPLTSSSDISAMESGQIVRVLLPRTAMASYGLPVNQERADVPVSAQVLIGQDGVARAIRFLSDSKSNMVQTGMHSKRYN